MTKTLDAIYEDGILKLEEPVHLKGRTRVRVSIEIPDDEQPDRHPTAESSSDLGENVSAEGDLEDRIPRMSAESRALYQEFCALQKKMPQVDFDIVETLREFRENG